jgi:hypothetical protein
LCSNAEIPTGLAKGVMDYCSLQQTDREVLALWWDPLINPVQSIFRRAAAVYKNFRQSQPLNFERQFVEERNLFGSKIHHIVYYGKAGQNKLSPKPGPVEMHSELGYRWSSQDDDDVTQPSKFSSFSLTPHPNNMMAIGLLPTVGWPRD